MRATLVVCSILFCVRILTAQTRLVRIELPQHSAVYTLRKFDLAITYAGKDFALALVRDDALARLRDAGYHVEIVLHDYEGYKDEIMRRGFYHTYDEVYAVLDSFAQNYPQLCRLDTIGYSVASRPLWAMRVTDSPGIEEQEPEIRLAGNIHGDEHIGTEITLYVLRYLLTQYGTNTQVQNLVNNNEIWILPIINPDGNIAHSRWNAHNVDLNRDYGYFWGGEGGSPEPLSQIETRAMLAHLEVNNVTMEYNYHSEAEFVNYVWDYHPADPPDSQHIINLSEIYADSANLAAINGYDWYQITGSLMDHTTGTTGALAWTIETLEPSSSAAIDQICYENRDALMDMCRRASWGFWGCVKDSTSSIPLHARIECTDPERMDVYSDPVLGDFHKMVEPGMYTIRVSANGYAPKEVDNIIVSSSSSAALGDILLTSDPSYLYAFRIVYCTYANHDADNNATNPRHALGPADGRFFSLGENGSIVCDMGSQTPMHDSTGNDFTVYEGNDGAEEGYGVYVSNAWDGPWYNCGGATGTASFDLAATGLHEARYCRIVDDGSTTSGSYAGFDLDAVQFFTSTSIAERNASRSRNAIISICPNPFSHWTTIYLTTGTSKLILYDVSGRMVRTFETHNTGNQETTLQIVWDGTDNVGRAVPSGIYFIKDKTDANPTMKKVVLIR